MWTHNEASVLDDSLSDWLEIQVHWRRASKRKENFTASSDNVWSVWLYASVDIHEFMYELRFKMPLNCFFRATEHYRGLSIFTSDISYGFLFVFVSLAFPVYFFVLFLLFSRVCGLLLEFCIVIFLVVWLSPSKVHIKQHYGGDISIHTAAA